MKLLSTKNVENFSRSELYAAIKENNLADEVKKKFGRNFTQVSGANLIQVIKEAQATEHKKKVAKEATKVAETMKTTTVPPTKVKASTNKSDGGLVSLDNPYEAAWVIALGILKDSGVLDTILKKI